MTNNKLIGKCNICGKDNVEIDLDFCGCMECAEKYAKEQEMTDKPESLKGKVVYIPDPFVRLEDIKSACEFYERYKNNPKLLKKEQPDYYWEIIKENNKWFKGTAKENEKYLVSKIDWDGCVFDIAFKDVIKKGD